jgi:flagella basal body P-ring formation protein FlgA
MNLKPAILVSLILFACLGGGFAADLSASKPSDLSPDENPPAAPAVPATPEAIVAVLLNDPAPVAAPPHPLLEADLVHLLTDALQQECVKDKGDLELHLSQPWTTRMVPGGPLTLKILDLPKNGLASSFIVRFELRTAHESLGTFQLAVQARLWRDIWVARSILKRGDLVAEADLEQQRRDVFALHDALAEFTAGDTTLELAEPLQAGTPLLSRSVRARPVIRRGQAANALLEDGALSITMKVEALEDGAPGQIIRARNSQSRRDVRGKVLNEQTILISL